MYIVLWQNGHWEILEDGKQVPNTDTARQPIRPPISALDRTEKLSRQPITRNTEWERIWICWPITAFSTLVWGQIVDLNMMLNCESCNWKHFKFDRDLINKHAAMKKGIALLVSNFVDIYTRSQTAGENNA